MARHSRTSDIAQAIILGFVLGGSAFFGIGVSVGNQSFEVLKTEAIEHNFAQFNPVTGIWEWKENNDFNQ